MSRAFRRRFFNLQYFTVLLGGASGHENSLLDSLRLLWSDSGVQMTTVAHFDRKWCSRVVFLPVLYAERANSRVDLQPLRCFGGVRQVTKTHFLSV